MEHTKLEDVQGRLSQGPQKSQLAIRTSETSKHAVDRCDLVVLCPHTSLPMQPAARNLKGGVRGNPFRSGQDAERDGELEQVLLDLGIEPLLAQGQPGERGRRDVLQEPSGGSSVDASEGKGWEGGRRGMAEAEDAVATAATNEVKHMLRIART